MALLWVCFFQTIAIGWFFGTDKFCDCVEQMTGRRPGIFWFMCWKYFAPAVMAVSLNQDSVMLNQVFVKYDERDLILKKK